MKISEILHLAADRFLSHDATSYWNGISSYFSCDAIRASAKYDLEIQSNIKIGMREMGLHTNSIHAFDEFEAGPDRQYARYVWLKFAAMIAEEQGV